MEKYIASLSHIYNLYVKKEMKGRTFVKILKESKLINKKFNSISADIIFTRVK